MKTAKPPAPDGAAGSNRRAQPVRQTRVKPPRTSSSLNRANALASAPAPEQPINILPGVTHFADAITALPKELVRHFTLLKEVDAKIFAPEAALFRLLHEALDTVPPEPARLLNDASSCAASVSAPVASAHSLSAGAVNPPAPASEGSAASSVYDPANIPRRTIFRDTALKIQEMLVSLEEKNHVIATANDALQKQLARIEEIWPHLEAEFSDEAKWGSTTHWAYVENRQAKANDKQAERSRREGAATLSAAAQQLAEEAAARSSDRKQAMAAKKNAKNQAAAAAAAAAAADADADKAPDAAKKSQGGKSRKPLPDSGPVGLSITPSPSGGPANKRRKVEPSKPNGGAPAERAMGAVFGNSASKQRTTTSPRETPAPEAGTKKRKALPTSSTQAKKSRTNAAMSPSVASSPVIGTFPDPAKSGRGSPAPSATVPRPPSSRARQNSVQSAADNPRQRPPPGPSSKQNGNTQGTPESGPPSNGSKSGQDGKGQKETPAADLDSANAIPPETEGLRPELETGQNGNGNGKETAAADASEEKEAPKREAASLAIPPASAGTVKTTKSGRASKPSTPAIATFAEASSSAAATSRSRPSRNTESGANAAGASGAAAAASVPSTTAASTKRSHKKGASVSATAAQAAAQAAHQQASTDVPAADKEREKDKDKDEDLPAAGMNSSTSGSAGSNHSSTVTIRKEKHDGLGTATHSKRADAGVDGDDGEEKANHTHNKLYSSNNASNSNSSGNSSSSSSSSKNRRKRSRNGGSNDNDNDNDNNDENNSSNNNNNNNNNHHHHPHKNERARDLKADENADEEDEDGGDDDEDEQVADDDQVYCFCNQGSYGEMVACDGEGCPREWFHLECVGLRVAPEANAKWYCEDCKKRLRIGERR